MRFAMAVLLLSVSPVVAHAQKPWNGKSNAHSVGKGTPANLSRHKDNSAAFLQGSTRNSAATTLTKLEQQSLHTSVSSSSKAARVRSAAAPKLSAAQTSKKSVPINFTGRSGKRGLTTTAAKSGGRKSPSPKLH